MNYSPLHIPVAVLIVLLASCFFMPAQPATAEPESSRQTAERDERMKWWREARFGMFIHWGIYAVPAGTYDGKRIEFLGEWIMLRGEIPVAEYREYARDFNPIKYDPQAWAQLAKEAGMKYIVITSKHHDGFSLFPSEVTEWDIADATPHGEDLIGPLADAARDEGLKFGLYYSQAQDWVHPGGAKIRYQPDDGWDPAHNGDFDKYLEEIAVPQVREILTRYQPDILWWDTPAEMTTERAEQFLPLLDLRPGIITNDRLNRPEHPGDFKTPEQRIPDTGLDDDWETCMTINRTWGYKSYDDDWKSTKELVRNLVDIASKGGNYLLNVGPKADGTIPQESIDRLREIGAWMDVNGEAIYGTTASPIERPDWGRITAKATSDTTTLYLHVFEWPTDGRLPVALKNDVVDCRLLADPDRELEVDEANSEGFAIRVSGEAPDDVCSVIALKIAGSPEPASN